MQRQLDFGFEAIFAIFASFSVSRCIFPSDYVGWLNQGK